MNEIADNYLESLRLERGASPNSVAAYSRDLAGFIDHLKNRTIDDITSLDITGYIARLQKRKLAASSIARSLSVIKGFFRYAVRTGVVSNNPAVGIMGPKLLRPLPETLTIKQVIKIIETPNRQTLLGRRDRALLEFLYGTGARISEALSCRIDDLIRELQLVRLYGKGKKERVVPLGRAGWAAIDEYLNRSRVELANHKSADFLFLGKRGDPLKRMAGWRIVKKYCRLADIRKKISPHTFRHSFASHLLIGGADLLTVQELLGHADISTTEIYTHLDRDFLIAEYREYHPREKWN